jgi:hypothetical protein
VPDMPDKPVILRVVGVYILLLIVKNSGKYGISGYIQ